jgi:hypothetical protein
LDASKLQLNQNPFICERFAKRFSQSHGSQLRDSANGVRRVITEVVGRTQCERNRCSQTAAGDDSSCVWPSRGMLDSSAAPPELMDQVIEEGKYLQSSCNTYRNLLVCGDATVPSVQNLLRSAPSLFVAFSLSILGYV